MISVNLTYWQFSIFIILVVLGLLLIKVILNLILKQVKLHRIKKYNKDKKIEILKNFQLLLEFVKLIDSKLTNRKQKKAFWNDFIKYPEKRREIIEKFINSFNN
ncbi:hypothetical protein DRN69_02445 [Candidatus Pacearchaeota archaeon]|nr:MAG: hypothetical protein DRN69_02445 [Candidatus Pacearchaeota archaeon]